MASLLEDMIAYFTSLSIVEGDGIDSFRDFTPETPDNVLVLHEYAGGNVDNFIVEVHRSVQISVRDASASIAKSKAIQICTALKTPNLIVHFTPTRMGQVYIRQTPFKLGIDDKNRVTYAFNIGITTTIE